MARRLIPANHRDLHDAKLALEHLRMARDHLKLAACPQSLQRVRACIKSTEGALRHLDRRVNSVPY